MNWHFVDTRTWYRRHHQKFLLGLNVAICLAGNFIAMRWLVLPWIDSAIGISVLVHVNRIKEPLYGEWTHADIGDLMGLPPFFAFFGTILLPWVFQLGVMFVATLIGFVFTGDGASWMKAILDHVGEIQRWPTASGDLVSPSS